MEPERVVASLCISFRHVPPAGVPGLMDFVLASGASTTSLFSCFVNEFPDIVQCSTELPMDDGEWRNSVVAYFSAVCYLLKKSGTSSHMHLFIWEMLIPLLKSVHMRDCSLFGEVTSLFLDVIIQTNNWKVLGATIVPYLFKPITSLFGIEDLIYQWNENFADKVCVDELFDDNQSNLNGRYIWQDSLRFSQHDFSLAVSCNLLTLILNAALLSKIGMVDSVLNFEDACGTKGFVGNLLCDLSNLAIKMLSQGIEYRAAAIRYLLPSICKAFASHCNFDVVAAEKKQLLTRMGFHMKIWNCCKILFSLGFSERKDAYDVLSLCLSFPFAADEFANGSSDLDFDIKADLDFWNEIRRGLLDKESLVRKQSVHILRKTLNLSKQRMVDEVSGDGSFGPRMMDKKDRWADEEARSLGVGKICKQSDLNLGGQYRWESFLFLYEMLEEYGSHLVEAAWNHQMMLLLHSAFISEDLVLSLDKNHNQHHMGTAIQIFEWLTVLWERGFCHGNPQVRSLIMNSFLTINWEDFEGCEKLVSKDFILGPLILGLNDPVHHSSFGLKENYTSSTIEAAATFFCKYAGFVKESERIPFLVSLSSIAKVHSFGRAGLMCFVRCISSVACGFRKHENLGLKQFRHLISDESIAAHQTTSSANDKADLLDVFRFILECSKQHFNPRYRYQVCERIFSAASLLMDATDVTLETLLHFVSSLLHEYTGYGGLLGTAVKAWLRGSNFQLLNAIKEFIQNFIHHQPPKDCNFTCDDEELNAWQSEARRWARVLFLIVDSREHIDPILKIIQGYCSKIFRQKNHFELVPVKFLIIVSSLIEELEFIQENTSDCKLRESESHEMVDGMNSSGNLFVFDWFKELIFLLMEELVSFSELSSSIFWMEMPQRVILPDSVRGKLGGPSQRRLPSSLRTSVLEAMTSIKILASVWRWCVHFTVNVQTNSAQTFLWKFCWKIIKTAPPTLEVEAEMRIAAYEACAHALQRLVSAFSPLSLDLVVDINSSLLMQTGVKAPCDTFITAFMHNIDEVIDGGSLARSRQAILMNWKWICLESLLSIPIYAQRDEIHSRLWKNYYSDRVVSQIFSDLLECLENASEVSALPMLRSFRVSIELLSSSEISSTISSSGGFTVEMMWNLVHSSWVLHTSCNKRRVAPIAALLSAVLHHSLFRDESMHDYNNGPGPLKWFVQKIIEEGAKSPRTIRLTALHLCGLWLAYPNTIRYYIHELKLLTFYGSVAFDEDFEAQLAENSDAKEEILRLSQSLDPELTDVFINTELYARVSVAVLFSKLADMVDTSNLVEDKVAAISSGKSFLLELLKYVVMDRDLSKELYKKYSAIHRRKVRAWQMICALSRFVDLDIVGQVTSDLHKALCKNNLPSVRQYLETFAIYIYIKFPSLVSEQLAPQLRNYDLRAQALSSYVFIASNVILHGRKDSRFTHLDVLFPPIIPLLTSHHHTLRGFTQILVYHVIQKLFSGSNASDHAHLSLEKRCFVDLKCYLENNSDCAKLRSCMENYIISFDPVESVSPAGIFNSRIEDAEFECVPLTLMDKVTEFLNNTREDLRSSMANDAAVIKNEIMHIDESQKHESMIGQCSHKELLEDFQRKITVSQIQETWLGSLSDIENEDRLLDVLLRREDVTAEKLNQRQQIVVVASLIDRIPNLAGLARTCEVFRAAGLAIANKSVLKDKQFQLISVTAEKWVPLLEVPVGSLRTFLEKKKQEGFAVVGLEQTANSTSLDRFKFPTKTVLVLGREKEGIPVEIIHFLDGCIEIPQLGVVRSLNVHVSGAIALWEYTRQNKFSSMNQSS